MTYFYDFYFWLVLGVIVLAAHEIGHYMGYRLFGKFPSIQFKGFNLLMGADVIGELRGWQVAIISLTGIFAGFIPFFIIILATGTMTQPVGILMLLYAVGLYFDLGVLFKASENLFDFYKGD